MMQFFRTGRAPKTVRRPLFTPKDKENVAWFCRTYLKEKVPWLGLVMGMILIQGAAYQQFIALTEDGLRVIFENGDVGGLLWVCVMVLTIFSIRAVMSCPRPSKSPDFA